MLLLFAEYDMIIDVKSNRVILQTMKPWLYVNKIVCLRGWRKISGKCFLSNLKIVNVRHLKNISIPLSNERPKHLILTGKNGRGKTSVLEALSII